LNSNYLSQANGSYGKVPQLFAAFGGGAAGGGAANAIRALSKETQMLAEARLLRQHEDRLEARMKILENHNRLLDSQLKQLRNLLNNVIGFWEVFGGRWDLQGEMRKLLPSGIEFDFF